MNDLQDIKKRVCTNKKATGKRISSVPIIQTAGRFNIQVRYNGRGGIERNPTFPIRTKTIN